MAKQVVGPFPGQTMAESQCVAFDGEGDLWASGDLGGVHVHRRGEKKSATLSRQGSPRGLATGGGFAVFAHPQGPTRVSKEGELAVLCEQPEPKGVAISSDGERVVVGFGYPGGSGQHVLVMDGQGGVLRKIDDPAIRDVTDVFAFVGPRTLAFFAGDHLVRVDTEAGVVERTPALERRLERAKRVAPFGPNVFVGFAGNTSIVSTACVVMSPDGELVWSLPGEADMAVSNDALGVIAVVRGAEVQVFDRAFEAVATYGRAKKSFCVDGASLSDDGWLALANGQRSGKSVKAVEYVRVLPER